MTSSSKPWEHAKSSGSEEDPLAARFVSSLDYDKRLYTHDIRGSKAHAAMLEKVGLITADDLAAINKGLDEIEAEIAEQGDAWPGWKVELEDVHMCVEAALIEKAGDSGRKLHTGRSRNDQVATDLTLWVLESSREVENRCMNLIEQYVDSAERFGHIVMPSYTHLQRAQPIVVGGELLAWATAIHKAAQRFAWFEDGDIDRIALGSGAIAGSSLPLDRMMTASQLHPSLIEEDDGHLVEVVDTGEMIDISEMHISENAIEATASRDIALDFAYALTMTSMWLSRWAEQWIIYATTEFGFITLADTYTTGSSMMPQKQNPDMLELIRGKTGQVYGSLIALLTMCKGITIGYNRDLQEDKRHLFAAYDSVCDCLDMAAGIVRTTTFNEAKIKEGLDKGYLDATSLAEYLVTKGVPFRTSHQIVGRMVGLCEERGLGMLKKLRVEDFNTVCKEYDAGEPVGEDIFDWLGPENVVKRYQSAGNAGVSGFEAQLKAWKERLSE
jgi:argininosuccinate lyase